MSDLVICSDKEAFHWAKYMAYTEFPLINKLINDFPIPLSENFDSINDAEKTSLLQYIALKIASYQKKDERKKRVVVITCGTRPTICAMSENVFQVHVEVLSDMSRLMDTKGAQDTFVGGLFAQLVVEDSLKDIFENGNPDPMKNAI